MVATSEKAGSTERINPMDQLVGTVVYFRNYRVRLFALFFFYVYKALAWGERQSFVMFLSYRCSEPN